MQRLYVLFDSRCGLCGWARRWLAQQPAYLELSFVPAGSALAARLFPSLSPGAAGPPDELVVVSDEGGVYRDGRAWVMCLFALREYRELACRLATPALFPVARQAFALLSRNRGWISRRLSLVSDAEIAATLRPVSEPPCAVSAPVLTPVPRVWEADGRA